MRTILILWIIPVVLFWGWYGLSANDLHYGVFFLTRGFHDHVFALYSQILQMPAEEIPVKLAWLFAIDTLIVFGIAALRWYKHWLPQSYDYIRGVVWARPSNADLEARVERVLANNSEIKSSPIGPMQPAE